MSGNPATRRIMPPDPRKAERWIVAMLVAFVALVMAAAAVSGIDDLVRQIAKIDLALLATMLGLALASFSLRFLRWHYCARAIGIDVPIPRHALFFYSGFAMIVTPGKVGEVLRLWLLRQAYGYRYEATAPLLLIDRLSDTAGIAIVGCVGALTLGVYREAGIFILAVAVLANLVFLRPQLFLWLLNIVYRATGVLPRLFARLRRMLRSTRRLSNWRIYGPVVLSAAAGWAIEGYSFHLVLSRLAGDVSYSTAALVFCLSILMGVATMLPGGVGGAELGMVGLLIALGVGESAAVAGTGIMRVTTLWFAVLIGVLCLAPAMRLATRLAQARARSGA
ncbi:MAG: flippase-like domain-containing protein [Alphaproteobacteria bacterium]|nr:flippase-like domain-containing protein [Alphaproteobacteria bacterium]